MSELPSGWTSVARDDVCQLVRGITFPTTVKRFEPATGLIACLRTANVQATVDWGGLWYVPRQYVKNDDQLIKVGDILISTAISFELVGKVSRVTQKPYESTLGAFISLLRSREGLCAGFIYYQMSTDFVQSAIREKASTTTNISNVSGEKLKALELKLAPVTEQTRIFAKLEELLSDLDAGVAELKAAQKKLTQYRQSLLKAAVEGALTAEWRAQHPPIETGLQLLERILTERRARWEARQLAKFREQGKTPPKDWQEKYPEPVMPDTTDLPALADGWRWASAEQLCEFITKGTTPNKQTDDGGSRDIPFLRVTNLTGMGSLNFSDKVFIAEETHRGFLARSIVFPGDVLMNIVGPPLGQVSMVPDSYAEWNVNQVNAIFRPASGVLNRFVCVWLLSAVATRWFKARAKTTAGQTNLTLELCRDFPVPLPNEAEQFQICRVIEFAHDATERQFAAIARSLTQSSAQRQNILRAAFGGQLVPQDPNDEPASALLARIRAERLAQPETSKARGRKQRESV